MHLKQHYFRQLNDEQEADVKGKMSTPIMKKNLILFKKIRDAFEWVQSIEDW